MSLLAPMGKQIDTSWTGKVIDAGAAFMLLVGIAGIMFNRYELPGSIQAALPEQWGDVWVLWVFFGALGTVIGVFLRIEKRSITQLGRVKYNRQSVSLFLEYAGWLILTGAMTIYGGAVSILVELRGPTLITVGVAWFAALLALGNWMSIHRALMYARSRHSRGVSDAGSRTKDGP